jgi:hypothetical protein
MAILMAAEAQPWFSRGNNQTSFGKNLKNSKINVV